MAKAVNQGWKQLVRAGAWLALDVIKQPASRFFNNIPFDNQFSRI
jgi:hypothetical protein